MKTFISALSKRPSVKGEEESSKHFVSCRRAHIMWCDDKRSWEFLIEFQSCQIRDWGWGLFAVGFGGMAKE